MSPYPFVSVKAASKVWLDPLPELGLTEFTASVGYSIATTRPPSRMYSLLGSWPFTYEQLITKRATVRDNDRNEPPRIIKETRFISMQHCTAHTLVPNYKSFVARTNVKDVGPVSGLPQKVAPAPRRKTRLWP